MFLTDTTLTPEVVDELYENKARMHELWSTYEARCFRTLELAIVWVLQLLAHRTYRTTWRT